jgi:CRP-like cAMP-binding protein
MESLLKTIRSFAKISAAEEERLCSIVTTQTCDKGDIFIRAGTVPQKIAFVVRGLFRYYYPTSSGNEFTKGFFPENSFISSYTAMVRHRPSHYTIEALEPSTILTFSYADWKTLYESHAGWSALIIALLEKGYSKKENRERELLLFNAEERYRSFLTEYPELENRVKQHLIASYLGITPVALSRIRKGMRSV